MARTSMLKVGTVRGSFTVTHIMDSANNGCMAGIVEFGEAIKNPAYRIFQTEYSGCLDISAHA